MIILLIPLSPIGHVLVFGAIQRFFPDFFPSCFTEQRQNLLQLYETAEYSEFKINESFQVRTSPVFNDVRQHGAAKPLLTFCLGWRPSQQKVSRLALASAFIAGKISRAAIVRISQLLQSTTEQPTRINGESSGTVNDAMDENESPRK